MQATATNQVQEIAAYRVTLKRALRKRGISFDNEAPTEVLEALTADQESEIETVTFGLGAPYGLSGKTFQAIKKVEDYESIVYGHNGMVREKHQSVSYLINGEYYGNEFFVGK